MSLIYNSPKAAVPKVHPTLATREQKSKTTPPLLHDINHHFRPLLGVQSIHMQDLIFTSFSISVICFYCFIYLRVTESRHLVGHHVDLHRPRKRYNLLQEVLPGPILVWQLNCCHLMNFNGRPRKNPKNFWLVFRSLQLLYLLYLPYHLPSYQPQDNQEQHLWPCLPKPVTVVPIMTCISTMHS